jgi:hypothetical protein
LTVSPSLRLYSFNSFPSASAFPLNNNLWASAGGATWTVASWVFIDDIVSVGRTLSL